MHVETTVPRVNVNVTVPVLPLSVHSTPTVFESVPLAFVTRFGGAPVFVGFTEAAVTVIVVLAGIQRNRFRTPDDDCRSD